MKEATILSLHFIVFCLIGNTIAASHFVYGTGFVGISDSFHDGNRTGGIINHDIYCWAYKAYLNKVDNENDEYVLQNQYDFREMRLTMCSKETMPKESRMPFV